VRYLFLILTLTSGPLSAQSYGFLRWTVAEGLPANEVTSLAQDTTGYLWLTTADDRVARFDGERFEVYGADQGLPADIGRVMSVDGNLLVESPDGHFRYNAYSNRFTAQGADAGAKEAATKRKAILAAAASKFAEPGRVTASLQLRARREILIGTIADGLYLLDRDGNVKTRYRAPTDLPADKINDLLADRQGRFWIATGAGLVRMIPTGLAHFTRADGLAGRRVTAIGDGFLPLMPPFRYVNAEGKTDFTSALMLGLGTSGIQFFDGADFHGLPTDDPTLGSPITGIAVDITNRAYVSTNGNGITVLTDSFTVDRLTERSGLPDNHLRNVLAGDYVMDSVWAVGFDGSIASILFADSSYRVTSYDTTDALPAGRYEAAFLMPDGDLLLGDDAGGIIRWRPGNTLATYGVKNRLPGRKVLAFGLRRETQLWVLTEGGRLFYTDIRADKPVFAPLPSRFDRIEGTIKQLLVLDEEQEVWLGTDRGLVRIALNVNGRPDYARLIGRAEGFPGVSPEPGAVMWTYTGAGGGERIARYFGTSNGLIKYTPDGTDGYLSPPATVMTGVRLFYRPLQPADYEKRSDGTPELPAESNHLNFRYRAVDLTYPDRVRYQTRLRGAENDWQPLTDETSIRYAGLAPGGYAFLARATTDGGKTWGPPAEYVFRIAGPLWRQTWFQALLTLLAIGLLVGGFYVFYRRILAGEARKRRELEAKNQLLSLEQKALRLQMNPHFIFNALNGIRGLVDGEHDLEARQRIGQFARLMRGILNNSRRETISLDEEITTLTDYLEMERFCQPFDFTYVIHPPQDVDAEEVNLPSMLLQPFIENAVLHGLSSLKGRPGHITVTFLPRGRGMECTIADNGVGREAAAARKAARPTSHESVALDVTRQRIRNLGGRMEVEDRRDAGGKAKGTLVRLYFPIESW